MQADTGVWCNEAEKTRHNAYLLRCGRPDYKTSFVGPQAREEAIAWAQAHLAGADILGVVVYGPQQGYGGANVFHACGPAATPAQVEFANRSAA